MRDLLLFFVITALAAIQYLLKTMETPLEAPTWLFLLMWIHSMVMLLWLHLYGLHEALRLFQGRAHWASWILETPCSPYRELLPLSFWSVPAWRCEELTLTSRPHTTSKHHILESFEISSALNTSNKPLSIHAQKWTRLYTYHLRSGSIIDSHIIPKNLSEKQS